MACQCQKFIDTLFHARANHLRLSFSYFLSFFLSSSFISSLVMPQRNAQRLLAVGVSYKGVSVKTPLFFSFFYVGH